MLETICICGTKCCYYSAELIGQLVMCALPIYCIQSSLLSCSGLSALTVTGGYGVGTDGSGIAAGSIRDPSLMLNCLNVLCRV